MLIWISNIWKYKNNVSKYIIREFYIACILNVLLFFLYRFRFIFNLGIPLFRIVQSVIWKAVKWLKCKSRMNVRSSEFYSSTYLEHHFYEVCGEFCQYTFWINLDASLDRIRDTIGLAEISIYITYIYNSKNLYLNYLFYLS